MKDIEKFEEAIRNEVKDLKAEGINRTMFWAYRDTKDTGAADLNFHEVIWEEDIEPIVKTCREEGIEQITISSTFSGLTETLWKLTEHGCTIVGMKKVPMRYTEYDRETGKTRTAYAPALIIRL